MINAAIVGASLGSAMKYTAPALEKMGFDARDFMREVMEQLSGQGIPGAEKLAVTNVTFGENLSPSGVGNSGKGVHSLA